MALFESYERRIDKINAVLNSYGISSIDKNTINSDITKTFRRKIVIYSENSYPGDFLYGEFSRFW